jgi:hypothetical protein
MSENGLVLVAWNTYMMLGEVHFEGHKDLQWNGYALVSRDKRKGKKRRNRVSEAPEGL